MNTPQTQTALLIQAVASPGAAAAGNSEPANFLVVVTEAATGVAVTNLPQVAFAIIDHFATPGQPFGFSNSISSFQAVGTGAYHIQVKLVQNGKWGSGSQLVQIMVSTPDGHRGQTVTMLTIR